MESQLFDKNNHCELSVVMPCLNEAETIGICIEKAMRFFRENGVKGEVVIGDNGSTDGSQSIAEQLGAKVVSVSERGYGSALMGGIAEAKGNYVIMGDSDDSYDFLNLMPFLKKLREGYDLVMGNRFKGGIKPGAMPPLHKYLGNPVLSGIGRIFFRTGIGDFHCGLRGFSKEAFMKMDLRTTGMEFASEMVVKATLFKMKITEVPTTLSPDGRSRPPHLRSFRDGWRHLRFLLLYSPRWLFLYPGAALLAAGLFLVVWLLPSHRGSLDVHTMLFGFAAIIVGFQALAFAIFTKTYAINEKLLPHDPFLEKRTKGFTLEMGLVLGSLMFILGIAGSVFSFIIWQEGTFFSMSISMTLRIVIVSITLLSLGVQVILSSFFYSILKLKIKD